MTTPPQAKEQGTPRTDKASVEIVLDLHEFNVKETFAKAFNFARTLEIELAAAQESLRLANMSDYDRRQEAKEGGTTDLSLVEHMPIMDKNREQFTHPMMCAAMAQAANCILDLTARLNAPCPDVEAKMFDAVRLESVWMRPPIKAVPADLARDLGRRLADATKRLYLAAGDLTLDDGVKISSLPLDEIAHSLRCLLEEQRKRAEAAEQALAEAQQALLIVEEELREERQQNGQFGAGA